MAVTQGGGVASGTVTFLDGTQAIGTGTLTANGTVSFNISSLTLGPHRISASYAGSNNASASVSLAVNVSVIAVPTSLGLSATPNPAALGQAITFTASAAGGGAVPGGTVTFSEQGIALGTVALNGSGAAMFTTSALSAGTHTIVATLAPFGNYAASTSAGLDEVVTNYDFSMTVAPSLASIPSGGYRELIVTLTPLGGFTGDIQLSCGTLPDHAQCRFSNGTTALSGRTQTVTLTINTSDVFGYGDRVGGREQVVPPYPYRGFRIVAGLLLPLIVLGRRRWPGGYRLLSVLAIAGFLLGVQGCSGKFPAKTAPGSYPVVVTGTSITVSHVATLRLTVTQ